MGIIIRRARLFWIGSFVCAALLSILLNPTTAYAENWSWSEAPPTVFESVQIPDIAANTCPTAYKMKAVVGESDLKSVCIAAGDGDVWFGTYYSSKTNTHKSVVGFSYDSKMYQIKAGCYKFDNCLYLPSTDTLVTKEYLINGLVRSLVVYRNFEERLVKSVDDKNNAIYTLDMSNPDYIFQNANGYAWPIGGFSASDDGKWLAVEFRQRGIGLLNMETLAMKRISTQSFSYGTGHDPKTELAVSNDGTHVAIMGINAGLTVYDVTDNCGDEATDYRMQGVTSIQNRCLTSRIDTQKFIDRFHNGLLPRFNLEGGELSFYAISYNSEVREVSLRAAGYDSQQLDYLALGDSFASGEGETDDSFYMDGTNDKFEKCHLSTRSYPYLIAAALGIDADRAKSVACSGAKIEDIEGDDVAYWGEGGRLGKDKLDLDETAKVISQTSARQSFIPGRIHQMRFVREYKPKVVTIGIGGNDAGFSAKLKACLSLDTCEWADTAKGRAKTAIEIGRLYQPLTDMYVALLSASPNSKVYAIGYPRLIDSSGECGVLNSLLLNQAERIFIDESVKYMNQVISSAAQAAGIKYIDLENSLGDGKLCGSVKPSLMNGVKTGDDIALGDSFNWLKAIGQESFHPRPTAHFKFAEAITESVPNLLTYDYCLDELHLAKHTCSASSGAIPAPSKYWSVDSETNYDLQRFGTFITDETNDDSSRQKSINSTEYTFAPGSDVRAEVHSEPVLLGSMVADDKGAVSFDVELPANLSEGFHTVHLYGTSYVGEPIDLYQVIKYMLPSSLPSSTPFRPESANEQTASNPTSQVSSVSITSEQPHSTDQKQLAIAEPAPSVSPSILGSDDLQTTSSPTDEASLDSQKINIATVGLTVLLLVLGFLLYLLFRAKRH